MQQARQRAQAKRGLRELAALEDQAQQAAAKVIPAVNIPETYLASLGWFAATHVNRRGGCRLGRQINPDGVVSWPLRFVRLIAAEIQINCGANRRTRRHPRAGRLRFRLLVILFHNSSMPPNSIAQAGLPARPRAQVIFPAGRLP